MLRIVIFKSFVRFDDSKEWMLNVLITKSLQA